MMTPSDWDVVAAMLAIRFEDLDPVGWHHRQKEAYAALSRLQAENERLTHKLNEDSQVFHIETLKAERELHRAELERLREALRRARHELDQWVFADGTASYRVERAEAILDAALQPERDA